MVSSAYWDSLCYFLCIVSSSLLVFDLMASTKNLAAKKTGKVIWDHPACSPSQIYSV